MAIDFSHRSIHVKPITIESPFYYPFDFYRANTSTIPLVKNDLAAYVLELQNEFHVRQ